MSYYPEFGDILRYLRQDIAREISAYFRDKGITVNRDFRFLDVSANDGQLTDKVTQGVAELMSIPFKDLDVTALEPDTEAYAKLRERNYRALNATLEDWIERTDDQNFDLILCSHVFYHIPKEKWKEITNSIRQRLNDDGNLIIVLDSKDSEIYRFRDKLELPFQGDFGEYVFAQDYERMLEDYNITYAQRTINSSIEIPSYQDMVRFLAFVYRTTQLDIEKNEDKVKSFMRKFKTKDAYSVLDWKQKMFVINKT